MNPEWRVPMSVSDPEKNLKEAVLKAFLGRSGDEALASRIMTWKWKWLTVVEVEFLARWAGSYSSSRSRRSLLGRNKPKKDMKSFLDALNHDKLEDLRDFWGLLPVPQ
jgi:hypothetical protein